MTGFTDLNKNYGKMASYLNQPLLSKTITAYRDSKTQNSVAANTKPRKELGLVSRVNSKLEEVYRSKLSPVNLKVQKS